MNALLSFNQTGTRAVATWMGTAANGRTPLFALFANHEKAVVAARFLRQHPDPVLISPAQVRPSSCAFDRVTP
jgi:hypothetical protein